MRAYDVAARCDTLVGATAGPAFFPCESGCRTLIVEVALMHRAEDIAEFTCQARPLPTARCCSSHTLQDSRPYQFLSTRTLRPNLLYFCSRLPRVMQISLTPRLTLRIKSGLSLGVQWCI
jgi:hypothetical protein